MLRVIMKLLHRTGGEARVSAEQMAVEQRLDAILERVKREDRTYKERKEDQVRRAVRL